MSHVHFPNNGGKLKQCMMGFKVQTHEGDQEGVEIYRVMTETMLQSDDEASSPHSRSLPEQHNIQKSYPAGIYL